MRATTRTLGWVITSALIGATYLVRSA
jgi:hypothetical protein